ncbi:MAG: glutamate formimidoyltransferase [Candidatus Thalassarchaeaceae archaeon]|nr:glutamate formimidoyltransferase [Candidatus Thalassarchaeaceae archaeon]
MTKPLVECVPNFSEGKDAGVIDSITAAMLTVDQIKLLDVDMGYDFHRTVVTIVGPPEQVLESVLRGTAVALDSIDMRRHKGEHARMGAVDVVPFIPVQDVTMEDCIDLAERYGQTVANKFGMSVYLYAEAARDSSRVKLPDIRRGEYEGLEEKLADPFWQPDYGPSKFNPRIGITATGARPILIAYNVNLDTNDKGVTNKIAGKLRTSGVLMKDENGEKIIGSDGKPERINGRFQALQGAGWMYDDTTAQVSMNLLDYSKTGLHDVTDAIRELATITGHNTTAGELVGLVPLRAIIEAGIHYHGRDAPEDVLIAAAIDGLQLAELGDFIVEKRIIEFAAGV